MRLFLTVLAMVLVMANSSGVAAQEEKPITIAFTGDVLFAGSIKNAINQHGVNYPFVYVKQEVESADIAMLNLETAITASNDKYPKIYNFKAAPHVLGGIKQSGFDLVSLANNHAMDYREKGLTDTMNHLKAYKLPYVGAGKNKLEAYTPKRFIVNGKTISIFGFSHVLPSVSWYVQANKPGIASGYQLDRMEYLIRKEKKDYGSDYVFVNIHWGQEKNPNPVAYQKTYARKLIEAGADGIVGHHPHVLQGFEYYKGKPIAYSLGNFLFPSYVSGNTAETGILTYSIQNGKISMKFTPYQIHQNQIIKKDQAYNEKLLTKMRNLSVNIARDKTCFFPKFEQKLNICGK
ncbi:CapA family protein [Bacillus tianshenii]|nr:CapA family protein [Bacillus tianshenii]